jgi:hypothetical protein
MQPKGISKLLPLIFPKTQPITSLSGLLQLAWMLIPKITNNNNSREIFLNSIVNRIICGKYKNKFTFAVIIKGCFSKKAKAEIIPDEPDPDNAGVGKRN